jgi:hypothetical protein
MGDAVKIEITLGNGQLQLNGAIENLPMALGLLEMAKDALHKYHASKASQIQLAPAGLANAFKGDGAKRT